MERVLALDTTTRAGSVALIENGAVAIERRGDPSRTHAERLPAELLDVLTERGVATRDVDLFAVAAGPGSFTGLRIGIATIQGLAFVHGRRVAAISALDAAAHAAAREAAAGSLIGVVMDAHRRDVFSALYLVADGAHGPLSRVTEMEGPHVGDPGALLEHWARSVGDRTISLVGDGVAACAGAISLHLPRARVIETPALAGTIGCLASDQDRAGLTIEPAAIRALYVRRPDAEVERDRRALDAQRVK